MRISAENMAAAVRIATEGKQSEGWDLFRGQTNADWLVTSSAERLSPAQRDAAYEKFKRFVGWAETINGMKPYFSDPDSLWAIAQHYSLPTLFIDFSDNPHVAAFFACDTKTEPAEGQLASIVCLNSHDFMEFWKDAGPLLLKGVDQSSYPQLLRINVDNLWRLQKQEGSFLWNPIFGIERFYDFDRIVFPFTRDDPALLRRQDIYPIHQSGLEKLLTQFFMNERMIEGNEAITQMNIPTISISDFNYEANSWWPAGVTVPEDWRETKQWDLYHVEQAGHALPGASVELESSCTLAEISKVLTTTLSTSFIDGNRMRALDFGPAHSQLLDSDCKRLLAGVRRLWNGMRTLPYTSSEIQTALQRALQLFPTVRRGLNDSDILGSDGLYVEMASSVDGKGAYSRGTVTRKALIDASNPGFLLAARQHLATYGPSFRDAADEFLAPALLQLAGRPWERFTFMGLRKLMVEELIPTQIVCRVGGAEEHSIYTVIYFSPKEFHVFGLA